MIVEFEWAISEPDGADCVTIVERLVGTDLQNSYYIPRAYVEAVVKARRTFVNRMITSRSQAVQLFQARPQLEALRILQSKGNLDS